MMLASLDTWWGPVEDDSLVSPGMAVGGVGGCRGVWAVQVRMPLVWCRRV